jgi:hypothetical protein
LPRSSGRPNRGASASPDPRPFRIAGSGKGRGSFRSARPWGSAAGARWKAGRNGGLPRALRPSPREDGVREKRKPARSALTPDKIRAKLMHCNSLQGKHRDSRACLPISYVEIDGRVGGTRQNEPCRNRGPVQCTRETTRRQRPTERYTPSAGQPGEGRARSFLVMMASDVHYEKMGCHEISLTSPNHPATPDPRG